MMKSDRFSYRYGEGRGLQMNHLDSRQWLVASGSSHSEVEAGLVGH